MQYTYVGIDAHLFTYQFPFQIFLIASYLARWVILAPYLLSSSFLDCVSVPAPAPGSESSLSVVRGT